ncbi:hypothetical protein Drorol1_Dr00021642 [Drosera rotundifolia]
MAMLGETQIETEVRDNEVYEEELLDYEEENSVKANMSKDRQRGMSERSILVALGVFRHHSVVVWYLVAEALDVVDYGVLAVGLQ